MQIVYFVMPEGVVAERKYSDSTCKAFLSYSSISYDALCNPFVIAGGIASIIKEKLEKELNELKQLVSADDVQLVSVVEDYISLCNTYPSAVIYSEYDGGFNL